MKRIKTLVCLTTTSIFLLFSTAMMIAQNAEITNEITTKMTKYKYFLGRYKPSKFTITANEKPLAQEETKNIHLPDGKLNIKYSYEFGKHRSGAKIVTFEIPKDMTSIKFTFNWKKKNRILIKGLEAIKVTEIKV